MLACTSTPQMFGSSLGRAQKHFLMPVDICEPTLMYSSY